VIASFDPLSSLTLPFAFLTGIILFVSSLSSGWAQNWANYRELPERFRESPALRRWLGARGAAWLADFLDRHFAAAFGAITLAVMLVVPGVIGSVLGIPLDVRHVTLSMGSLVFSVASLGPGGFTGSELGLALAGILCIGLLNFGVSFVLALGVAMRARDLGRAWIKVIVLSVGKKILQRPLDFVIPPREARATGGAGQSRD
jgi:site-specific recombinase